MFVLTYAAKLQAYVLLETIPLFSGDPVQRQFPGRKGADLGARRLTLWDSRLCD